MFASLVIQALGATGLFASRAFVPAFAAALILRFGPEFPIIRDLGLLDALGFAADAAPSWFTSDASLLILGLLAALEIAATKNPDARALLNSIDQYFKPLMAALTTLGVATAADTEFIQENLDPVVPEAGAATAVMVPVAAGITMGSIPAILALVGTFITSTTRSFVMGFFRSADEDDDVGLQKLLSWGEDLWSFFGLFFLILFPIVMLILIGIAIGFVFLVRWWAHRKEEASRVSCENCGELMYRCAMRCGKCDAENPKVCDVGWLGQSDTDDPADMATQPYQLAEARRCPVCADKLEERLPRQTCENCKHELFADPAFVRAYADRIATRLPLVLLVGAGLSFIPVIGLIPGVLYYRLALVAPFRRYVPWTRNLLAKWGIGLLFFVLIAVQWVPVVGAVTVPAMALVGFLTYRKMFLCLADNEPEDSGKPEAA
ncbi:MAG: hypothetical protein AAF333_05855 [Planctomycetota bacterium]